jgi:NAD+ synthase
MSEPTVLAIAQFNPVVGDIEGNAARILAAYRKGIDKDAQIVVFPELALIGYPPEDLVLSPSFRAAAMEALRELAKKTKDAALITGALWEDEGKVYNAAVMMAGGRIVHVQPKLALPNYGVFDEKRIFTPGEKQEVASWRGHRLGLMVCEDIWQPELAVNLKKKGAQALIAINASPFEADKLMLRRERVKAAAKAAGLPVIYANMIGGQDDIVFDGGSFSVDAEGVVVSQLPQFAEGVYVLPAKAKSLLREETLWEAMKLGLKDYVKKNGFSSVVLGLSGGIDSAVSAAVAVDALGKKNVHGVLLPSPYTSRESTEDAETLAKNLGIETITVPITEAMLTFEERLNPVFKDSGWMENVAVGGNLQARLRGVMLMALSNRFGWMLLSTGNKSELAVGYSTLYGDSCGGYNVLKDLYKTQVYELAGWRNRQGAVIPRRSIMKDPTAELAPGQRDQDQLPPYDLLDAILGFHLEGRMSAEEIIAEGYRREVVEKVVRMVKAAEYKRRQSCPGVKLTSMLFGKDRRYPLTNGF